MITDDYQAKKGKEGVIGTSPLKIMKGERKLRNRERRRLIFNIIEFYLIFKINL